MLTLAHVRAALDLSGFNPEGAMLSMAPAGSRTRHADAQRERQRYSPKQAGVLVLLTGPEDALSMILIRRTDRRNDGHSGQMSFPGGRREESDADFSHTALREASEELGIDTREVTLLGALTPIYIPPTHYDVFPFVGYLDPLPNLEPNAVEVAAVYHVPLTDLLDPANRTITSVETSAGRRDVPAYMLCGQIVWGATAIILSEFEARLRAVLAL